MLEKPSIYNTLTRKKEVIKPCKGKTIRLFVCGPTVYDFSHIGHARTYVIFDAFAKYLKRTGFSVRYLQNITNVDDRIILRAKERGVNALDLAAAFEVEHLKDMQRLGITSVKKYARATDYIKQIISQVRRLEEKGYAYRLPDGIYFDIARFKDYGKLSGRTALQAEDSVSRIDYAKDKRNRGDFCLWKFTANKEHEPSWPSPWGEGRPGWHIEDTAITEKFFGPQYEIHGGAVDLIFPHHEAEIAQMEALSGKKPLAKYWMHTGFLTIKGQKMAKSLNNFLTIGDLLNRYSAQQLRYLALKGLWRAPLDYSDSLMIEVRSALEKITEFLRKLKMQNAKTTAATQNEKPMRNVLANAKNAFYGALADDFNTPKALAALFECIRQTNKLLDQNPVSRKTAQATEKFFREINDILGIIEFEKVKQSPVPDEVQKLVAARQARRAGNEWQQADELRKEIRKYGYEVEDTEAGPILKKM